MQEFLRYQAQQAFLHLVDVLAGRYTRAVGDAKDVCVDGDGRLAEGGVEDDVGCLASNAG